MLLEACSVKDEKTDNNMIETDTHKEFKNYFTYLDNISKALSERLDELEAENEDMKSELIRTQQEFDEKNIECEDFKEQIEALSSKLIEFTEKYEELNEKFEKEQKRYNLIVVENNRNMDELKNLRKENKLLQSHVSDSKRETILEKLKKIIK